MVGIENILIKQSHLTLTYYFFFLITTRSLYTFGVNFNSGCFSMRHKCDQKTVYQMSHVMRKRDFCLCENKDADLLFSTCTADQRLCFHYNID